MENFVLITLINKRLNEAGTFWILGMILAYFFQNSFYNYGFYIYSAALEITLAQVAHWYLSVIFICVYLYFFWFLGCTFFNVHAYQH
jgi:hypothetical protein